MNFITGLDFFNLDKNKVFFIQRATKLKANLKIQAH